MNLFLPMVLTGLAASVHCVFMCGTLVLTYALKGSDGDASLAGKLVPNLAYQAAKLMSYMAVGLVLGAVGAALSLGGARGWVSLAAGLFMVLLGIQMADRLPWLRRFSIRPPRFLIDAIGATRRKARTESAAGRVAIATPVTFGLLTGFMPCGPLQAAQLFAASAGSALGGMVAMLGFGLGTVPLMLGFGTVSSMLGDVMKRRMQAVAAIVVVVLGMVMVDRGAMVLGSPVTFTSIAAAATWSGSPDARFARGADGVVEIPVTIRDTQYQPSTLALPAGQPVRLVVDRQEDVACSSQLAIPQLGVLADLRPNAKTVVDVPAAAVGRYTLTCGMGMMSGTLDVGGAAPRAVWQLALAGAIVAGLGYLLVPTRGARRPRPAG